MVHHGVNVHANDAFADENIRKSYFNRNICTPSDSQAAIKAFDKHKIILKLVWNFHQSLMTLAECNKVYSMWKLGHKVVENNEVADQLARRGLPWPFIVPEPAYGISERVAKWANRNRVYREHRKYWQSILEQKYAKGFLGGCSA